MPHGDLKYVENSSGITTIPVATTSVVYSKSFSLRHSQSFGIWLKIAGTNGDILCELQASAEPPTTEGAVDTDWVTLTKVWLVSGSLADSVNMLIATPVAIYTIQPIPMRHFRLKLTGQNSNPAGATLIAAIFAQGIY